MMSDQSGIVPSAMRLELFTVKNFRSINKAEKLPLGEFTVLLGPNNEGKSNILQAMVMGMLELSATATRQQARTRRMTRTGGGYDWERDYPRSLQDSEQDGKTTMHFDFQLTDPEVEEFYAAVGSRLNGALPITLVFGQTGRAQFRVRKPRHAATLSAKRAEIAKFVADRVQVQYVEAVRTGESVSNIVSTMLDRELSAAIADNPEYAAALALLRELQQPVFDSVAASITGKLQALLPDVQAVRIEYLTGAHAPQLGLNRGVQVIVDDGTATDLTLKGDGVQSLAALAMTQHYSRERARAREFILAVEEPEAHLHPRAIHGLRDTLRDTASTQQVIITTHSPLFVNRLDLASNIIVRKNRAQPAKSVGELREALGVRTADNLAGAEVFLVVEGTADEVALRALLPARSQAIRTALTNGLLRIMRLHGGGKLNYLLTQLQDSLSLAHVFLDNDEQGKTAARSAQADGLLDVRDLTMATCRGARESEFEDLVDPERYRESFSTTFGVSLDHGWLRKLSKGKWSKRMQTIFEASGTPWDESIERRAKTLVAEAVAASPNESILEQSEGILAALASALETKLASRTA
jgi:AAA ATPase domain